jgi:hypothetical protein
MLRYFNPFSKKPPPQDDATDECEASIPTENKRNDGRMSGTVRRQAAMRTCPETPVAAGDLTLSPQDDEDMTATKRPRLEASTGISTAEDADTFFDAHARRSPSLGNDAAAAETETVPRYLQALLQLQLPYRHQEKHKVYRSLSCVHMLLLLLAHGNNGARKKMQF